jgi:hypothetical protein
MIFTMKFINKIGLESLTLDGEFTFDTRVIKELLIA